MQNNPLLSVQGIAFSYPGQSPLFKDVSFDVNPGSCTVLLGANGTGKSTLLQLMIGGLEPQIGQIYWGDNPLNQLPVRDRALRMALVPQSPPTSGGFTVEEMVSLGRTPHLGWLPFESKKDKRIVEDVMDELNVLHLRKQLFTHCSGGEKERIMVARALAQEPKLLLLDEPTSNQDLGHQSQLITALEHIRTTREVAIFMVTHDWNLALSLNPDFLLLANEQLRRETGPEFLNQELVNELFGERVAVEKLPSGRRVLIPRITNDHFPSSTPGSGD